MSLQSPSSISLFEEVVQSTRSIISEEEQRFFHQIESPTILLEELESLCSSDQKDQRRPLSCYTKFARFSNGFAPYFDIIALFVQIKPEWLICFWGSIKLVFQLGSCHVAFLEKIADMFESISSILPQYQQHYDTYKRRPPEKNKDRLVHLMSFIYADIVQFCQNVSCMFLRSSKGYPIESPAQTIWKPFNLRFFQLHQRIVKHQRWFDKEMRLQDQAILTHHYADFVEYLRAMEHMNEKQKTQELAKQEKVAAQQVDRIKTWISSSFRPTVYERVVRQRHPRAGTWFLSTPEYRNWKDPKFSVGGINDLNTFQGNWPRRMLSVQAKPGFGKTFLSGVIIDDLCSEYDRPVGPEEIPPTTAFFHFNSMDPLCGKTTLDALHAIAAQLVHAHRDQRITMDAIALLLGNRPSDQHASYDDTVAVLCLLLRQYPTFIVIDGIDECSDAQLLLTTISDIIRGVDCRVVLLSRPDTDYLQEYEDREQSMPYVFSLNKAHNLEDIGLFLGANLNNMATEGLFGSQIIQQSALEELAHRANGLFLWASFFIKYLNSPNLTPYERHAALLQSHLLEGLDALYNEILDMLSRRHEQERAIAADTFKWLSSAITPLNTAALYVALSIVPGQPISDSQYIPEFPNCISVITCGLVEPSQNGILNFSHLSVKGHLESRECRNPGFSLCDASAVHSHLAARCLSYLAHDIPKKPLEELEPFESTNRPSGATISSGVSLRTLQSSSSADSGYNSQASHEDEMPSVGNPSRNILEASFPLLRYASLSWPVHLSRSLSLPRLNYDTKTPAQHFSTAQQLPQSATTIEETQQSYGEWIPVLSQFLIDRFAVTTWVEASWRYHLPPNLSRLVPLVEASKKTISPQSIEGRELRWVILGLKQLVEALNELRKEHNVHLRANPSLIWKRNIQSATDAMFWPVWNSAPSDGTNMPEEMQYTWTNSH
ncbi:hypothetical protein AOQ84DRAFT_383830 [Glonium stellatum]|uniref:NACHT domain-containing protein n=1 Tax=Glonium stellatum TaxID=574774 RepID=A0A8E2EMC5_9PEZI|nr:hypothetical protein AOQ84DRAFT_383830 [Glonium stellatum]